LRPRRDKFLLPANRSASGLRVRAEQDVRIGVGARNGEPLAHAKASKSRIGRFLLLLLLVILLAFPKRNRHEDDDHTPPERRQASPGLPCEQVPARSVTHLTLSARLPAYSLILPQRPLKKEAGNHVAPGPVEGPEEGIPM